MIRLGGARRGIRVVGSSGGVSGYPVDMLLDFLDGAPGDILSPAMFDAAQVGGVGGGPWTFALEDLVLTHTKIVTFSDIFPFQVSLGGNNYDGSDSAKGYEFDMQAVVDGAVSISSITIGNPTTVVTATPHDLSSGQRVALVGISGDTGLNTSWVVTVIDGTTFTVPYNSMTPSTGGVVRDPLDGVQWTFPAGVHSTSVTGLVKFNVTPGETGLDHIVVYSGGFQVMQLLHGANWITAHGQASGGGTVNGGFIVVEGGVCYRFTININQDTQTLGIILINNTTEELVGISLVQTNITDAGLMILQDYLVFQGGNTQFKMVTVAYNANATLPIGPFTCPEVTGISLEQTGIDQVSVTFSSLLRDFKIERSDDSGATWDVLESDYSTRFDDVTVPIVYVDNTVEDAITYIYRITAFLNNHIASPATSDPITVDNGGHIVQPDEVAGLAYWFKADAGVDKSTAVPATNNDTAEFWLDQSSNHSDANQTGNPAVRPVFKTNIVNSLPVVRADGTDLMVANGGATIGTVFVVVGNVTESTANAVMGVTILSGASARRIVTFFPDANTIYTGDVGEFFGLDFVTWVNGVQTNTFPSSFGLIVQRASTPQTCDGVLDLLNSEVNAGFIGDVAEIAIYDSCLSTADRTDLELYFKTKYGL